MGREELELLLLGLGVSGDRRGCCGHFTSPDLQGAWAGAQVDRGAYYGNDSLADDRLGDSSKGSSNVLPYPHSQANRAWERG